MNHLRITKESLKIYKGKGSIKIKAKYETNRKRICGPGQGAEKHDI